MSIGQGGQGEETLLGPDLGSGPSHLQWSNLRGRPVLEGSVTQRGLSQLSSSVQGMRSSGGHGVWGPASVLTLGSEHWKGESRQWEWGVPSKPLFLRKDLLSQQDLGQGPFWTEQHHTSVISSPSSASSGSPSSSSSSSSSEVTLGSSASAKHLGQEQTNR